MVSSVFQRHSRPDRPAAGSFRRVVTRRFALLPLALVASAALSAGCGSEAGGSGGSKGLQAQGAFTTQIDSGSYGVDYTGATVTALLSHKLSTEGAACVPSVKLEITPKHKDAADESCKLALEFAADFDGSLKLKKAEFYAKSALFQDGVVIHTYPCEGWTQEPKSGEVVYTNVGEGSAALVMSPIAQPQAAQAKATLHGASFAPTGAVKMKFLGRTFDLDLSKIRVSGDAISEGSADVACERTYQPLPFVELKDINPNSPYFGETYTLDRFKGKYVAVLMGAGWCASCRSQTDYMDKIKRDLEAAGRTDFAMVAINDKSASSPSDQKKLYSCTTKGKCAEDKDSFTTFQGTATYGWSAFVDPDNKLKGKKNDCFIYGPDGRFIFKHIGKGTVNLGQFDSEVRAALNKKIEP